MNSYIYSIPSSFSIFLLIFIFSPFVLHYSFSHSPPLLLSCRRHSSTCSGLTVHTETYPLQKNCTMCTLSHLYTCTLLPIFLCLPCNSVRRLGQFVCNTQVHTDVCIHSVDKLSAVVLELAARGVCKCELAVASYSTVTVCLLKWVTVAVNIALSQAWLMYTALLI